MSFKKHKPRNLINILVENILAKAVKDDLCKAFVLLMLGLLRSFACVVMYEYYDAMSHKPDPKNIVAVEMCSQTFDRKSLGSSSYLRFIIEIDIADVQG
ncbi:CLUMA_CG018741, isoform A [Clunio marinus]|uniref:CLUMA_CG018741, isoform A n=1 Tax=Clunio marinus TaxID=568069 RepID=A0A1J1IZZ0_9DIPT|nr:CLUMA_CG018741, isoform A [Clunio marinus]